MRIALFTETFLPNRNGVVHTLQRLLEYLNKKNMPAQLYAPAGGPLRYADAPVLSYRGFAFPMYPEIQLVPPVVNVREHLDRFQPDIIHVANPLSLGIAGLIYARKRRIPIVASFHTDVAGFAEQWGYGIFSDTIWSFVRFLHNMADLNLAPSEATRALVESRGFVNTEVWSRGVDTVRFSPQRKSSSWRERLSGGEPERPLLLFAGRLSHEKRIAWLRTIHDSLPGVRLAIAGDGPAADDLRDFFAGTPTVFTGFLDGLDLARAYASADAFVFPGQHETFGNVLLEAMAAGLPVVAAAAGGPLDFVRHNQNGLLFQPEDMGGMIRCVQAVVEDATLRSQLRQGALKTARDRNWDAVLGRLVDRYAELLPQRHISAAS